jgi:hypothetical protein
MRPHSERGEHTKITDVVKHLFSEFPLDGRMEIGIDYHLTNLSPAMDADWGKGNCSPASR